MKGENRAEYGANIIKKLSAELTKKYGKGFTKSNLYSFYSFYKAYPDIFQTVSGKSALPLSWSHYAILSRILDKIARTWYEEEAVRATWSVRTLQRNVESQYYYRLLKSQLREPAQEEVKKPVKSYEQDKLEFIKNPVIVEFLGLTPDSTYNETKLESSIISNLQKFLMEMGKGYAFVARQQHIKTEKEDYYIDPDTYLY